MSTSGWGGRREGAGRKPAGYEHPAERIEFEKERAEHERVKRIQREFQLELQRGEYVRREAVRQAAATMLALLSQSIRSIPDNCERQFALPPDVVEGIQQQTDAALQEAANALKALSGE